MPWLSRFFPFLRWPVPTREDLMSDLRAGLSLGLILVPQAVAYAMLAGMPPITGLYASLIPPVLGVLFGSCQLLGAGPVALTSMLVAGSLIGMAEPESPRWVFLAIWLALLAGGIQLLMGFLRLGRLVNLLPGTVIAAFTQAAALLIILSQVPTVLGLRLPSGWGWSDLFSVHQWGAWLDWRGLLFGLLTLAFLLGTRRWSKQFPVVLIGAVVACFISWIIGFKSSGGSVVGDLPAGLPELVVPGLPGYEDFRSLLPAALVIAVVSFVEALASAKTISRQRKERWNANQELIGQGIAKLSGGFSGAFPVSASFSRSALNLFVGARTGWSAMVAFVCVLITLLWFTPVLAHLPRAFLAAVIIVPVTNLISPSFFLRLWRLSRPEASIAAATFLATLLAAPQLQWGILAGFVLALSYFMFQQAHPRIIEVGAHEDGSLRDRKRFSLTALAPDVLAVRMDADMSYITSEYLEHFVLDSCRARPEIKRVLLYAGPMNSIDTSGVDTLRFLITSLRDQGKTVYVAGLKKQVEDVLYHAGLLSLLGGEYVFRTEQSAIRALTAPPEDVTATDEAP
ncbi:MAG: SulP family inorganic anion transporter [Pigmentiphaga sp.]|nr:SulP family inorganic anion transporter [Pigmentiphaga sp.]